MCQLRVAQYPGNQAHTQILFGMGNGNMALFHRMIEYVMRTARSTQHPAIMTQQVDQRFTCQAERLSN